jgi:hypothetical protein
VTGGRESDQQCGQPEPGDAVNRGDRHHAKGARQHSRLACHIRKPFGTAFCTGGKDAGFAEAQRRAPDGEGRKKNSPRHGPSMRSSKTPWRWRSRCGCPAGRSALRQKAFRARRRLGKRKPDFRNQHHPNQIDVVAAVYISLVGGGNSRLRTRQRAWIS